MSHSLLISDLHLCASRPRTTAQFHHFLQHLAPAAEALYILGDLFEYWAGDDDLDTPLHQDITARLNLLAAQGTRVFIMHGNRDFLMGERLAQACRAELLADPTLLDLYGTPTLLSHGDTLCTDDHAYQTFRQQVRQDAWQQGFLALPLAQRKAQIEALRLRSEQEKQQKTMEIMDVNMDAVHEQLRQHGYPRLIHGHTHRPARHLHEVDGHRCERWVLAAWEEHGAALRCDRGGCSVVPC